MGFTPRLYMKLHTAPTLHRHNLFPHRQWTRPISTTAKSPRSYVYIYSMFCWWEKARRRPCLGGARGSGALVDCSLESCSRRNIAYKPGPSGNVQSLAYPLGSGAARRAGRPLPSMQGPQGSWLIGIVTSSPDPASCCGRAPYNGKKAV